MRYNLKFERKKLLLEKVKLNLLKLLNMVRTEYFFFIHLK